MRKVPEPHMGSIRSVSPFQPLSIMMPAASTSLMGASVCATRQPRLNSGSPLLSSDRVTSRPEMWTSNRISGLLSLMLGRLPYFSLK